MAIELPRRFTRAWIVTHVPELSYRDADFVLAAMRAKGWTEAELRERVYPLLKGPAARLATRAEPAEPPAPERRRKQRGWRRPLRLAELSAVAGILGSLSAVLALFGPFGGGGSSRSSVIYTTPSSAPSVRHVPAISHDAQSTLLSKLPAGVRSTCQASDPLRKRYGALAGYHCSLAGADQVAYFTFRNNADLSRAFAPTPISLGAGGCGKHWNVESGYHTPKSKVDVGSLKCFTYKGTAWIEWTRDDMLLYAYTSRSDGDRTQLFRAWNAAGPTP